jgi:crossover junction endodeoxyribonuclease RuvC
MKNREKAQGRDCNPGPLVVYCHGDGKRFAISRFMGEIVRVIGIDPGLAKTGFAVVEPLQKGGQVCNSGNINTDPGNSLEERLSTIYHELSGVLRRWSPDLMVLEDVFVVKQFPMAAMQLGEVRGVIRLTAKNMGVPISEIKPTEVKSALTGSGRASKEQIKRVVRRMLHIEAAIRSDHISDAMALALTGLTRNGLLRW